MKSKCQIGKDSPFTISTSVHLKCCQRASARLGRNGKCQSAHAPSGTQDLSPPIGRGFGALLPLKNLTASRSVVPFAAKGFQVTFTAYEGLVVLRSGCDDSGLLLSVSSGMVLTSSSPVA